jgi:hypothetical protein
MKNLFALFLAIVLVIGVVVPSVVQLQGDDVYEMKEKNADDSDDDLKESKEKDLYVLTIDVVLRKFNTFFSNNTSEKQYHKQDSAISENHASLPELPPEA